jgi:hypothetical protein
MRLLDILDIQGSWYYKSARLLDILDLQDLPGLWIYRIN